MTCWAVFTNGRAALLPCVTEAVLSRDLDAPADSLLLTFKTDKLLPQIKELRVYSGTRFIFRGPVDEQNFSLLSSGLTLELLCRSMEALLLDNEAAPRPFSSATAELFEERLIKPLGLFLADNNDFSAKGEISVEKGESCWEVLSGFGEQYLGSAPYVDLKGGVHFSPREKRSFNIENVLSAALELAPCKKIGRVYMQSFRGEYDTIFNGSKGVLRTRYLSSQSGKDPREMIEDGEKESFSLSVSAPGFIDCRPGDLVSVKLPKLGEFTDCPVKSMEYRLAKSGGFTRLTLERGEENVAD